MAITLARHATMDSDRREINVTTDASNTKIGEVQITPTQYSIMDRLKVINDSIQLTEIIKDFNLTYTITRPADTTAYTVGDIINGTGVSVPQVMDFSAIPNMANKRVNIQSWTVATDKVIVSSLIFFNTATIGSQAFTDNTAFNPTLADYSPTMCPVSASTTTSMSIVTPNVYSNFQNGKNCTIYTDANSKVYFIWEVDTAFTPTSSQVFKVALRGQLYI